MRQISFGAMLRLRNEFVSRTRGDVQRLQRNVLLELLELPYESWPRKKARSGSSEAARETARLTVLPPCRQAILARVDLTEPTRALR